MRLFEFLFTLINLAILIWLIFPKQFQKTKIFIILGGFALLAVHLFVEGYRWQMVPLYLLFAGGAIWLFLYHSSHPTSFSWIRLVGMGLFGLLLAVFILPPTIFPINRLPEPTGPYQVGTLTEAWVDFGRNEIYGEDPEAPREFVTQTWYPAADGATGELADYLPQSTITGRRVATSLELPFFLLDHLDLIETYSLVEVEPAEGTFPILLFSHGYNSSRFQSTSLMEDLASHGYIVVAMSHPYGSAISVFPDGRIIFHNEDTLIGEGEVFRRSGQRLGDQWAADMQYLLDQLMLKPGSLLEGRYDFDQIGVFGHSTGGGATFVICDRDPRCKAAFGLDVWLGPAPDSVVNGGSNIPVYFLMSEFWPKTGNTNLIRTFIENSPNAVWATIQDTGHYDFSDMPFLSPLASRLGFAGGIDPYRGQEINREFVRGFFDLHLKDGTADYLYSVDPDFPEVRLGVPNDVSQNDR